jgi:hypothetical protein
MAKIKANCPHCGAANRYDATAAGLHVSCAECGGRFQLDYAKRQRGCLSSCLALLLAILLLGAAAGGLVIYFFGWPLPVDLPFVEQRKVAEEPPPPTAPAPAPDPTPAEEAPLQEIEQASDPAPPERALPQREWVDNTGSFRITARLIEFAEGKVRLEKENGEVIEVSLERLSEVDRKYVRETLGQDD